MKKKGMIIAFLAIIAMGLAPLGAQTTYTTDQLGSLQSNTSKATAGLFTNDVDDYMSYHDYAGVLAEGSKWFGFVSGKNVAGGALDLGYARKVGGIYLGTWFRGNIFNTSATTQYKSTVVTPTYNNTLEILTQRQDVTTFTNVFYESTNNIEFLIGVAGMGIKVGFFESIATNKNDASSARTVTVIDYLNGQKDYTNAPDNYTRTVSYIKPYLGWGGAFNIGSMGLKPYANIGFEIYGNKQIDKYSNYTVVNGVKQNVVSSIGAGQNTGYMTPQVEIGAWLDLAKKETSQMSVGLEYGLDMRMYSNNAVGFGSVDGTVTWAAGGQVDRKTEYASYTETNTSMTYTINERSYMSHTIKPAYKVIFSPIDSLNLGFMAEVPVTITSDTRKGYTKTFTKYQIKYKNGTPGYKTVTDNVTYSANGNIDDSTLGVNLNLNVGATYQLIPDRFGIRAGIGAIPVRYSHSNYTTSNNGVSSVNTTVTTQDDGSITTNDKDVTINNAPTSTTQITEYFRQYTATLNGGFTFNFNSKAALDMAVSSGSPTANTFNLDLTTVNVIVTLKF